MTQETVTVAVETEESSDELEVPVRVVELLSEKGDTTTDVVGDLVMLGIAQQAHGIVHHAQGNVDDDLAEAEQLTMELFEERFGQSYADVTGHDH
ncbi:hypothetical protein BRC61_05315 [Halobacteriales archaeon QH_10_65_19]|jgi:hypothetical protein|nr:MAG: hypothetical protein BRC61_05315 [Halobacteriales archaeon QH_10_65_19]